MQNHVTSKELKIGDKVKWTYTHWLNSTSHTRKTKTGIFNGKVNHKKILDYKNRQLARVMFKGNKTMSTVPLEELFI